MLGNEVWDRDFYGVDRENFLILKSSLSPGEFDIPILSVVYYTVLLFEPLIDRICDALNSIRIFFGSY
jgi:hypothetical protein